MAMIQPAMATTQPAKPCLSWSHSPARHHHHFHDFVAELSPWPGSARYSECISKVLLRYAERTFAICFPKDAQGIYKVFPMYSRSILHASSKYSQGI